MDTFEIFDASGNVNNNIEFSNNEQVASPVQEEVPMMNQPAPVIQGTRIKKSNTNNTVQNVQPQMRPTTVQNSNIISKDTYTDQEWRDKMNAVDNQLRTLEVDPTNLNSSVVAVILSKIDVLLTNLVIDNANIKSKAAVYDGEYKLLKQLQFQAVKEWAEQNNVKLTVDDKWALVSKRIDDNKTYENNMDVYHLAIKYQGRATELEDKIKLLQNKQSMMITYCGLLKLDYSSNNVTPSVPTPNQFNQMRS